MYDLESALNQQIYQLNKPKPTLIFPEFTDTRIIQAAASLLPFTKIVMPGSPDQLYAVLKELPGHAFSLSNDELISRIGFISKQVIARHAVEFRTALMDLSQGKKWEYSEKNAASMVADPLFFSILAVRLDYADAILGGVQLASKDFFLPCLRMLKKEKTVFELGLFILPDAHPGEIFSNNIAVFSDVAINLSPDAEALSDIAVGTCRIVRDLIPESVLPIINGVIVSYSTKGSGTGPGVELVRAAGDLLPKKLAALVASDKRYHSIQIESELQISVALSEKAAQKKMPGYTGTSTAGRANVLTVTNLDFGNSLYHLYATTWPSSVKLLQVGGIFGQTLDFSRSSSAKDVELGAKALILQHLRRVDYTGECHELT